MKNAARTAAIAAPTFGVLAFLGYIVDDVANDGVLFDETLGFFAVFLVTFVMVLVVVGWPAVGFRLGTHTRAIPGEPPRRSGL